MIMTELGLDCSMKPTNLEKYKTKDFRRIPLFPFRG